MTEAVIVEKGKIKKIEPVEIILLRNSRLVLFLNEEPIKCFSTYANCCEFLNKSYGFAQHAVRTGNEFKIEKVDGHVLRAFKDIYEYNDVKYFSKEDFMRKNREFMTGKKIKVVTTF